MARKYGEQTGGGGAMGEWFSRFTATTCGVIAGGIVILGIVRAYIYWSVRDTAEKIEQKMQEKKAQQPTVTPK
jgi:hypothetical protein